MIWLLITPLPARRISRFIQIPQEVRYTLKYEESKFRKLNISLFDASGKKVFARNNVGSDEEMITTLPKGFYILKAEIGTETVYTTPVIIR
jgi:hypothetical protein